MAKKRVVIIGSGFGGLFAAKKLRKAAVDITLISRTSHHLFQPLLYQVATGILSPGDIAPSTREILASQKNVAVLRGLVEDIDVENREVCWRAHNRQMRTPYDTLIVAAGATQSYFGNEDFSIFAPGLKTIDDALEIRARILGAFELAELTSDPQERAELLTFMVIGGGPTGVEVAGQICELATRTLRGEFRNFSPAEARVILVNRSEHPLRAFGENISRRTIAELKKLGVEVWTGQTVVNIDSRSVTLRSSTGEEQIVPCSCKVWSAGVQGAAIGKKLAAATGAELDRAGRVRVEPDLTLPGHPEIFVIGDLMAYPGVPGVAQGAIQSADFATQTILARLHHTEPPAQFNYRDKGSMAIIGKAQAVAKIGKVELHGFPAWAAWCALHLFTLTGFKSRFSTLARWAISFLSSGRSERSITNQQLAGRLALKTLGPHATGHLMEKAISLTPWKEDTPA